LFYSRQDHPLREAKGELPMHFSAIR